MSVLLQCFRDGGINCLIATDVAARGLDIPEVELVIQCNPPKVSLSDDNLIILGILQINRVRLGL